ncbi:MAG: activator-dependent family glycosyltransferase [Kineosporiaceae bacterium]
MRVLMATSAEWSHAAGLVPLGWGLRTAGHDVLVATQPALVDKLAESGLPMAAVGRDHRLTEVLQRLPAPRRRGEGLTAHWQDHDMAWSDLVWSTRYMVRWWWGLINNPMVADLVTLCRQWRPDLVIWETTTYAGAVAARANGVPHARFVWSVDLLARMRQSYLVSKAAQVPGDQVDPMADWLGSCASRSGTDFDEELILGQATITQLPASLRRHDAQGIRYLPTRYVPYNGRAVLPDWLRRPPERPRVGLTLGTSAIERFGSYAVEVADLLRALGDLDIEVVATIPDSQRAGLGPVPANVRVEAFVSLGALLPTCTVLVDHGGPGTVCTAVAHGVPQLVVPAEFDAPVLAGMLAETGAGLVLDAEAADPGRVRAAVAELLSEPSYAAAASRLNDEWAAEPDPCQLATALAHGIVATPPAVERIPAEPVPGPPGQRLRAGGLAVLAPGEATPAGGVR